VGQWPQGGELEGQGCPFQVEIEAVAEGPVSRRNLVAKVLSDRDGKQRVETLLARQKERVEAVLMTNRDLVEALRDALIERDELVGEDEQAGVELGAERAAGGE
jgi:cell division protease FtsH